jgi:hypothetical protein
MASVHDECSHYQQLNVVSSQHAVSNRLHLPCPEKEFLKVIVSLVWLANLTSELYKFTGKDISLSPMSWERCHGPVEA